MRTDSRRPRPHTLVGLMTAAAVALAGCAYRAPLEVRHLEAAGQYHGPVTDPLEKAIPHDFRPPDDSVSQLLLAFERAHGIEREAILREAFERHFAGVRQLPRGQHWTLKLETIGLESPDLYTEWLKPSLMLTLHLQDANGRSVWHGREGIRSDSVTTPQFTLEQLVADPSLLDKAWRVAIDLAMSRLARKHAAGIRDRREGYAE